MRPALFALLALTAAPASAQQNGNVYNGTAHEPAKGDVVERERSAGVLPPEQAQKQKDGDVEQLDREVLRRSQETLPKPPPDTPAEPGK